MKVNQTDFLNNIRSIVQELAQLQSEYWQTFSNFGTWQFWILTLMLIAPLIVLFIAIDKSKMLLLGFFGLNFHVWIGYVDSIGLKLGLWAYPYHLLSILPSFSLDASLIPVSFILLYQWTLNNKKNIYLYGVLLSAIFAFVLKPTLSYFHFFNMYSGLNYIHIVVIYIGTFLVSILITNLFIWLQKRSAYKNI